MLLWEALAELRKKKAQAAKAQPVAEEPVRCRRLPYDKRCSANTKDGHRCRCRIRAGKETCLFHDPEWREQMRKRMADSRVIRRRRLSHIADGYLRKLSNRSSVTNAMDRLYREVRMGYVTAEMGQVMFAILSRLLDSGLLDVDRGKKAPTRVTKVERIRAPLKELLTRTERSAWRKAVAGAPDSFLLTQNGKTPLMLPAPARTAGGDGVAKPEAARVRQAAS